MINLEKMSGLPLEIGPDYKLKFKGDLPEVIPSVRKFSDMSPVLMDKDAKSDREEMYYMYRDLHMPEHEDVIRRHNIRYDITILPPAMIGREFNKTVGHYHPHIEGSQIAYPEVYEVLHGEALFLIQKLDSDGKVRMAIAFKASTGDKIIYPPNYGHVIVNAGNDVLAVSNWVSDKFESNYKPIADKAGMAYYVVKGKNSPFELLANPSYEDTPAIRVLEAKDNPSRQLLPLGPLYNTGISTPDKLEFLNKPAKFAVALSTISS